MSAADLIEMARLATTEADLDEIEAQAEGRVTVINAVHDRRDQLARQGESMTDNTSTQPVVDPSPAAAPIAVSQSNLADLLAAHPAPASPPEVLELEPNSLEKEGAVVGPDPQIDPNTWVTMTKPDGSSCLIPLSNVPYYEAKGFTRGAEEQIEDLVAYHAEKAQQEP